MKMTRLAYSRLPTTEGDGDVDIQMPEPPKMTAAWKYIAPCLFILAFLIVYMDILSFDMFPNKFLTLRTAETIEITVYFIATRTADEHKSDVSNNNIYNNYHNIENNNYNKVNNDNPDNYNNNNNISGRNCNNPRAKVTTVDYSLTMSKGAVFRRRPEVAHVDCSRLLKDDTKYAKEIAKRRPNLRKNAKLDMSCEAIQKRILPARNPDTGFPIMYARIVNTDYEFLEDQLATNYANENVFCFSIDKKASRAFHERIFNLEKCLPNVVVAKKEEDVDGSGHNQNEAHLDCMGANHDVMIKTHQEMTEILRIYGGANEVEINECPDHRCISELEKNLGKLELCPKSLRGMELARCKNSSITFGKGAMQAILSRAAVDFIFDEINIRPLMKEMNEMGFGVDEQLYESLQITPEIRLPGGFHYKCRSKQAQYISRISIWSGDCKSGNVRHSICVYGVEDLPFLAESKFVMANKMMPEFDQAVTSCISELLFNRTRDGSTIDRRYYENINAVSGENAPTGRRLSFTEMILGAPGKGGFSWGQGLLERKLSKDEGEGKKDSITNEERFKELMKRETNVLNDGDADNDNPPSGRRLSFSEMIILNSVWDHREKPTDENTPRGRKLSFTEKVLGSPEKHGGFSWGHGKQERERKMSMEEVGAERNFTGKAVGSPDSKSKGGFWGHHKQERERKMSMEEGGTDKHEDLKRHKEMPKWRSQDNAESTESNESGDHGRRQSIGEHIGDAPSSSRRLSFSEMILGSPGKGGFSWGQGLLERKMSMDEEGKSTITNEERFKELLKRETQILNDEGTFSRKNYMKK
ncbi:hypothetical protein PRIPAC_90548 [Pristionchus pacificus]|uniref:Uncharacterized protein n=1 Tax=Pristionchus pacificus TaxID=54126 RepID=A0A2A6B8R7_PRIPA|nr:hypothetical protein PRIPAC_90548 [Pristionchus pacificus]|eukprot:PDM62280.1 hypothetical protein PRIPAC_51722 [Pristionchus pacificus]